jgi:hypothetical protein
MLATGSVQARAINLTLDAVRAMLLIRLAISIFALTLFGLAFSLSSAQSQNSPAAAPAIVTPR